MIVSFGTRVSHVVVKSVPENGTHCDGSNPDVEVTVGVGVGVVVGVFVGVGVGVFVGV